MDAFEIVLRYQEENRWFVNESYQFSFHDPAQQNTIAPSELLRTPDRIDPEHLFDEMDKYLDISLRYAAFWLSIHYYEACWLELAEKSEFIDPEDRWKNTPDIQDKYWNQGPNLTPFCHDGISIAQMFSFLSFGYEGKKTGLWAN